jgi:hypothetical protein
MKCETCDDTQVSCGGYCFCKETKDITSEYDLAEISARGVDFEKQYNIPDIAKLLKSSYILGYTTALIDNNKKKIK